jgi:hypothetical protein
VFFGLHAGNSRQLYGDKTDHRLDLLNFLPGQTQNHFDLPVRVGGKQQLACRIPQEVADQRRQRIKDTYRKKAASPF